LNAESGAGGPRLGEVCNRFALVIFDCDGVLVDSEMLSASVLTDLLAEEGFAISPEIFRSDFLGRSFASASARARERFGRPLPDGFEQRYRARLLERMRIALKPMPGAGDALASLRARAIPFCLATSSSPQRLAVSLEVTGLADYFTGCGFTASEVLAGKPAPDLFLHAASRMGVEPSRCLVIEDSEMGARAGLAAGMTVWHFRGGAHIKAGYELPGDVTPHGSVDDMASLLAALFAAHDARA
jgi:HAD superfamily hydrolase (TIGR01509 family)